jgi:hypothetical protein
MGQIVFFALLFFVSFYKEIKKIAVDFIDWFKK